MGDADASMSRSAEGRRRAARGDRRRGGRGRVGGPDRGARRSTRRVPVRCSCVWWRAACVTRTSGRWSTGTGERRSRCCSDTKAGASSRRSETACDTRRRRSGRAVLGGAVRVVRSLPARRPAPLLARLDAASARAPGARRRAAFGDALARHARHPHGRACGASHPDARRAAASERMPPRVWRLHRRRRRDADGEGVARRARGGDRARAGSASRHCRERGSPAPSG